MSQLSLCGNDVTFVHCDGITTGSPQSAQSALAANAFRRRMGHTRKRRQFDRFPGTSAQRDSERVGTPRLAGDHTWHHIRPAPLPRLTEPLPSAVKAVAPRAREQHGRRRASEFFDELVRKCLVALHAEWIADRPRKEQSQGKPTDLVAQSLESLLPLSGGDWDDSGADRLSPGSRDG